MSDPLGTTGAVVGVVGGVVGLAGGAYGTFRSIATDRRTRALQRPWILERHDERMWLLRSNLPGVVTDVQLVAANPQSLGISSVQGGITMHPGDFLAMELHCRPDRMGNTLIVSYRDGRWWKRKRAKDTVQVPPFGG